jgi:predicted amidohydrolase
MKCKIALAQINTKLGDVEANLEKHLRMAHEAFKHEADLLIFPELSLTGYVLQDLVPAVAIKPDHRDPIFHRLLEASRDLDMVVGFVDEDERHRFYVASAYLSAGEVVHVHRKVYLPTYGIFDEKRFFAEGDSFRSFNTRFGRMGILICEDFWHLSAAYALWLDGTDIFLLTSASPGRGVRGAVLESAELVEQLNQTYARLLTSFVIHANRVGFEDGLNFWGGATAYDPDGNLLAKGPYDEEALTYADLDLDQLRRTRVRLPLLRDEKPEIVLKAINLSTGRQVDK